MDITPTQSIRNGKIYDCERTLKQFVLGKQMVVVWGACNIVSERKTIVHMQDFETAWEWETIRLLWGEEMVRRLRLTFE
eukprot:1707869-Karenia_brevis.AAC.1